MNDHELTEWLMENGGPAIRLRLITDIGDAGSVGEIDRSVGELLEIEEVQRLLRYLDPFRYLDQPIIDKRHAHDLIHCHRETSLENFFPRLLDLGLRAGMPLFDEKMQFLREAFMNIGAVEPLYGWVICEFFSKAGYAHNEMIAHMQQRLDRLQMAAQEQIVDIYFKEEELQGLPKQWKGKRIIKHELNPYAGSKPLPTVHDLTAFAYFPQTCLDEATQKKINVLVNYILLPAFQMLPEGYGFIWNPRKRICHASGWSPTIPFFQDFERPRQYDDWYFLDYLDMLSRFAVVHPTEWFQSCLDRVDQFKTKKGTYIFPEEYLHQKPFREAYLSKTNLNLKRSDQKLLLHELISTLFVLKIKRHSPAHHY